MDLRESYQRRNPWMPVPSGRPRDLVGSGHAGLTALLGAEFWVDAGQSPVGGGYIKNLGTGGSVLDARFGSTTGTDTNDPSKLDHSGVNYLYLPGVAGNSASAPDSAAVSITGDTDFIIRVAMDSFTGSVQGFISHDGLGADRGPIFYIDASGFLTLFSSPDGTLTQSYVATSTAAAAGLVAGTPYWLRCTFDVDNGASGRTVTFQYAADDGTNVVPTSWTTIGSPVVQAGVTTVWNSAAVLAVGDRPGSSVPLAGKVYRAIVRNGIGGPIVFDADFTRGITSGSQTSFTESSSNAATVTINRATSGRKAVAVVRPVLLLGTDDYLEVADNALLNFSLSQSFSVLAVIRQWGNIGSNRKVIAKGTFSVPAPSWILYNNATTTGTKFLVSDAVAFATADSAVAPALGALNVMTGVRDVGADLLRSYNNGTASLTNTDPTTGTSVNALPMRIGSEADVVAGNDMEFVAAAVFRRALTATEIASIVAYYGAS